jgi:hypothetical protein
MLSKKVRVLSTVVHPFGANSYDERINPSAIKADSSPLGIGVTHHGAEDIGSDHEYWY